MDIEASELKDITAAVAEVAKGNCKRVLWRGRHKELGSLVRAINRALRAQSASRFPCPRPVVWSDPICTHTIENGELHRSCLAPSDPVPSHSHLRK